MKRAPSVSCSPRGSLAEPENTDRWRCRCGAVLRLIPYGEHDWKLVDEAGRGEINDTPAGLAANPVQWWADLAQDDINTYSMLRAHLALGQTAPWIHVHIVQERLTPLLSANVVPWCCGSPMNATPSGWRCRVKRRTYGYAQLAEAVAA